MPSMPGITTSSIASSGFSSAMTFSASSPFIATKTS